MDIEQAMTGILTGMEEILIQCDSIKHRNSLRTLAFRTRAKMAETEMYKNAVRVVGINQEDIGEALFIRFFLKTKLKAYTRDENGELVEIPEEKEINPEHARIIRFMLKDGKTDEEVFEVLLDQFNYDAIEASDILKQVKSEEVGDV